MLHPGQPQTAPFVYIPLSESLGERQDLQEVPVSSTAGESPGTAGAAIKEEEREETAPEENLVTAEDILKGFRGSESEGREDLKEELERDLEDPGQEPNEEEELARILRYRGEYQAQQGREESDREAETSSEPDSLRTGDEQEMESINVGSEGGFAAPEPDDDYSIIERINAEEIARSSRGDVLSERASVTDPSPQLNLYEEARGYVLESIRAADAGKNPDVIKGESVAERVISSIEAGAELLLSATDRRQEFAISSHSTNTAIFAVRIAQTLGLSRWQQLRIALAALLHEIGVVRLPKQLIYKTDRPTLEEIKILRQRPIYAARCLKGVEHRYDWLPEVVSQVYERENGTGYPLGLNGVEISEEAKVIGMADLFDACIHRRPYREALTGYQALFELTTDQARTFSDRIVKALIKSLSLFPYNEFVVLSTGEIGKVIDINLENLSRPVIEVLYDKMGAPVETKEPVDLAQNPSLYISKALPFTSLPPD
jgi:HD-GYP domain-containing protein (c-di-GMP phosphodiesterase class II)